MGKCAHRRLYVIETHINGDMEVRQPTIFLILIADSIPAQLPDYDSLSGRDSIEQFLLVEGLQPLLNEVSQQRAKETQVIAEHLKISLEKLINRQNLRMIDYYELQDDYDTKPDARLQY